MSTFTVTRVVFGDEGFVEITNSGTEAADPDGLHLCQFPQYPGVPAGELAPGASVQVSAAAMGGLNSDDGEVALYSAPEWTNPDAIISYVQWGASNHKRSPVGAEAGVWGDGEALAIEGATEISTSSTATTSADWQITK